MFTFVKKTIFISLLSLLLSFHLKGEEPIIIAGDQWCPYVCDSLEKPGFSVELVQRALKLANKETAYTNSNFPRLIKNIEKGKWHVVTGTNKTFSPNLYISKEPVAYTKWVFVTHKGNDWVYKGSQSLEEVVLGTVGGYVYSPQVMLHIKKNEHLNIVEPLFGQSPQESNLKKLISGRIDAFIDDEAVIKYWAKSIGALDQIRIAGVDQEIPLYCGLNSNDKELAKEIDLGIRELRTKNKLGDLLKKYNLQRYWR